MTLTRVRSILFDWGVESHLWKTPTDFVEGLKENAQMEQAFGLALPYHGGFRKQLRVGRLFSAKTACSQPVLFKRSQMPEILKGMHCQQQPY